MEWLPLILSLPLFAWLLLCLAAAGGLPAVPENIQDDSLPFLSVLIPFRNEEKNLALCLQALQSQKYPAAQFEIILIDDASEDASRAIAESYLGKLPLSILRSAAAGKKQALNTGVAAAQYPLLLTLDADSLPGPGWMISMASAFSAYGLDMLCGPVSLRSSGRVFEDLQQAESAAIVGLSAFMLGKGWPATCNGANLMFRKTVFEKMGGYGANLNLASGDDDLLMHEFFSHSPDKTRYTLNPASLVQTQGASTWKEFIQQRLRWVSKRRAYRYPYNSRLHALVFIHLLGFYALCGYLLLQGSVWALCMLLLKYLADLAFASRLRTLLPFRMYSLLLLPFYQCYALLLPLLAIFVKPRWKGRLLQTETGQ